VWSVTPEVGVSQEGIPAVIVNTLPFVEIGSLASVFVAEEYNISPVVYVPIPVPPYNSSTTVPCHTPVDIVPRVVIELCPT
jgi:hypothetical protein